MIGGKQRAANAKKEEKKGKAAESDKIPVKSDSASSLKPKSCAFHIPIFPIPLSASSFFRQMGHHLLLP